MWYVLYPKRDISVHCCNFLVSNVWLSVTPGSSVHGIFPARIQEWISISFFRGSSWPRDQMHISCVSCIAGGFFTHWAIREVRLFCLLLSPRVCSNSCPLSQWCYLTISSSAAPFSHWRQSFPASACFLMSVFFYLFSDFYIPLGQIFQLEFFYFCSIGDLQSCICFGCTAN